MARIPPRVASRMSVVKALNALAGAGYVASKGEVPENTGGGSGSGSGDMLASVYDPTGKEEDIFSYADQAETDAKSYTDSEISGLASVFAALGVVKGFQQFTSSGTYTPTEGTKSVLAIGCAGGGGGGNIGTSSPGNNVRHGGPGGAGELRAIVFEVTEESYTVTIGSGGAGGSIQATASPGGDGGNTVINDGTNDIFVCIGGGGGAGSAGISNGNSGTNGSGGSGGISLDGLIISAQIPSDETQGWGAYNTLFGGAFIKAVVVSSSSGPMQLTNDFGTATRGKGSGGGAAWHSFNSTTSKSGATGGNGYLWILEFG